jgi:hypothetical protein
MARRLLILPPKEDPMASESGSSTAIVALFAIVLLAMVGAFIAWQAGVFGDGEHRSVHKLDVNVNRK